MNDMLNVLIAVLLLPLTAWPSLDHLHGRTEKVLYEKESLYQYIAVVEDQQKKERYIFSNKRGLRQAGMETDRPERLLFEYTRVAFIGLAFLETEPQKILFVGLGAGSMPAYFNRYYPKAEIDISEIDPEMKRVAQRYFGFREKENMRVVLTDGRVFVKKAQCRYDLIFLDAYQTESIPFHLTTREFLQEVHGRLKEKGVVVSNILSPSRNKFFNSMIKTYKAVFSHLYIFRCRESGNYLFVATKNAGKKDKKEILRKAREIHNLKRFDLDLASTADRYEYSSAYERKADVLTDDFAPVGLYRLMKDGN